MAAAQVMTRPGRIEGLEDIEYRTGMVCVQDERITSRYLDFGYPLLNQATLGLDHGLFLIPAPANLGKCLAEGTLLTMADGKLTPIESLTEDTIVSIDTKTLKTVEASATRSVCNGIKPCWKVTTSLGHEIMATDNHPFYTLDGWVELKKLKPGSRVAVARETRAFGTGGTVCDDECLILGLLLGDGSINTSKITFTTADGSLLNVLVAAVERTLGKHKVRAEHKPGNKAVSYAFSKVDGRGKRVTLTDIGRKLGIDDSWVSRCLRGLPGPSKQTVERVRAVADSMGYMPGTGEPCELYSFLKRQGVHGDTAGDKCVPNSVLTASRNGVRAFLRGLFACDGSAFTVWSGGYSGITYTSKSERLVRDIQNLLLRFGIVADIRPRNIMCGGVTCSAWQLDIYESGFMAKFVDEIGILSKETQTTLAVVGSMHKGLSRNSIANHIPCKISSYIMRKSGTGKMADPYSTIRSSAKRRPNCAIHRDIVASMGRYIGDEYLQLLGKSDLVWDRLESIEPIGERRVYDIEVPVTHNFIANNFIVHNSAMILNIECQLIKHNDDVFVLSFSLDDSFADRTRNAVARLSKTPINWIKLPARINDQAKQARRDAYKLWRDRYLPQIEIIDETGFHGTARQLSVIHRTIGKFREKLSCAKLVVTIDGFHNVETDNFMGDEYAQIKYLSGQMKHIAEMTDTVIIASAHTPKGGLKRGLNQESIKGGTKTSYDAKIIAPIYSDFKINRAAAEVYHDAILPHDGSQTPIRLPVIELDITKNKAASFSDVIYFRFFPEYAYVEEAPDIWQASWRKIVYGTP